MMPLWFINALMAQYHNIYQTIVVLLYIKEQLDIVMICVHLNVGLLRNKECSYGGARLYNDFPREVKDIENFTLSDILSIIWLKIFTRAHPPANLHGSGSRSGSVSLYLCIAVSSFSSGRLIPLYPQLRNSVFKLHLNILRAVPVVQKPVR